MLFFFLVFVCSCCGDVILMFLFMCWLVRVLWVVSVDWCVRVSLLFLGWVIICRLMQ